MAIFDKLEETLHSILSSRRKCKILGDININTPVNNTKTKENWNLIRSEEFTPLIFEATRITEISESSIDHIHTIIAYEISDHLPVFTIIYDPKYSPFPETIEIRDFKKFDRT